MNVAASVPNPLDKLCLHPKFEFSGPAYRRIYTQERYSNFGQDSTL